LGVAQSPLAGWLGHRAPFAFEKEFVAAPGIVAFQVGTPPILSMAALPAALRVMGEAGMEKVALGGTMLTSAFLDLVDSRLPGFRLATPRDPHRRGSHVSLEHPEARPLTAALVKRGIVPDFRAPNLIRFGFCPLYNGFEEGERAVALLEALIASGDHLGEEAAGGLVT
jgi:kynureninase